MKLSDGFGSMPSKDLTFDFTDPVVGHAVRGGIISVGSTPSSKQMYRRRQTLWLLCKCSFKTSPLNTHSSKTADSICTCTEILENWVLPPNQLLPTGRRNIQMNGEGRAKPTSWLVNLPATKVFCSYAPPH